VRAGRERQRLGITLARGQNQCDPMLVFAQTTGGGKLAMVKSDSENLLLVESPEAVDRLNQEFYNRFPYPWPPMSFPCLDDGQFETVMVNQSIGDWNHGVVPPNPHIWVAGCGTTQAIYTALRFPGASVVGSDVSLGSLRACRGYAQALKLTTLRLRQESLNDVGYEKEFDYILCTGVLHHNADPKRVLAKVARALKDDGILELMVYNRFHRVQTSAFQKAVRLITETPGAFDEELKLARSIMRAAPAAIMQRLRGCEEWPEPMLADALLQPVEYSFTVESLRDLLDECGLEIILPCYNQYDKATGRISWNMQFGDAEVDGRLRALPDGTRWHVTNLLLLEHSPMLWFFVRRKKGQGDSHYEWRVCERFLDRRFVRAGTSLRNYVRTPEGDYRVARVPVPYPRQPAEAQIRAVVSAATPESPMRDVLKRAGIDPTNQVLVNEVRVQTTTSLCPYLRAIPGH
jgi:SAM-dependent methyltransferase